MKHTIYPGLASPVNNAPLEINSFVEGKFDKYQLVGSVIKAK